ncbi:MAG TPA: bifunctional adenosylcobinamide kinase/adenosylcobinamide-phosphate guanylyltransferase, partial [Chloroflexota bacterium]|nr:bifunctional adenosylcobinamide kinase/adenosylcobinamide-phosphate guanylyltransferase [Chloroflexota bacterium]
QRLAEASGHPVVFIATASPIASQSDPEMRERIAAHQRTRPTTWLTVEAPDDLVGAIHQHARSGDLVLIDCLTIWVSNVVFRVFDRSQRETASSYDDAPFEFWRSLETTLLEVTKTLLDTANTRQVSLILVSNEVGLGIVPAYPLGRHYRDLLGKVNQTIARRADSVILMVAGLPIDLRRLAPSNG